MAAFDAHPAVADRNGRAVVEEFRECRPAVAVGSVELHEAVLFFGCPFLTLEFGVAVGAPSLAALFGVAAGDEAGDDVPAARAVGCDNVAEEIGFFRRPAVLADT